MPESLDPFFQTQSVAAAAVLLLLLGWESLRPFFHFFGGGSRQRLGHLARNLGLGALNAVLIALVFVGLWWTASAWAEARGFGLLHVLERRLGLPLWAHALGVFLLFDAWMYAWHRINHRVPFLWRFHRVHHADPHMDVTTASRFHAGEIILSSLIRIPVIVLLGVYLWELVLYETIMFAVVQFHHANIVLPRGLDRALRAVIVTPAMHKVHHSRIRVETDSNYGSLFAFWDRLGRSFRLRDRLEAIDFGLDEYGEDDERLGRLLRAPLDPLPPPRDDAPIP